MEATGLDVPEREAHGARDGAAAGRWLVWSGSDEVRSSGRLDSSLELRAERTDDGVLVAPPQTGAERIVWVADMRLEPSCWPHRLQPPEVRLAAERTDGPEIELTWRGLAPGQHALRFTVLCRPAGHLTFENAAFDPTVRVSARSGETSLGIQPYRSLPPVEITLSGAARLEGGADWARGIQVAESSGRKAAEDRFSPGRVLVDDPGGELRVRVRVLAGEADRPAACARSSEPAGIARPEWAACSVDPRAGGLSEKLAQAAADPSASPEPALEGVAERASGGPLWSGLEGLPRWDERVAGNAPVAVEHAAQLVTLLRRRAREAPAIAREAARASSWFRDHFWLSTPRRLADRALGPRAVRHGGLGLRPHMLIAAGLPEVPLRRSERRAVLDVVNARLLTTHGLRTLDAEDLDFDGGIGARGAIWPWLVAPLSATAVLAGGMDRLRLRRLVTLALGAATGPEAWVGRAGSGGVFPAGNLVFEPNRRAAGDALALLSGIRPGAL